jgi:hypothetical protein
MLKRDLEDKKNKKSSADSISVAMTSSITMRLTHIFFQFPQIQILGV